MHWCPTWFKNIIAWKPRGVHQNNSFHLKKIGPIVISSTYGRDRKMHVTRIPPLLSFSVISPIALLQCTFYHCTVCWMEIHRNFNKLQCFNSYLTSSEAGSCTNWLFKTKLYIFHDFLENVGLTEHSVRLTCSKIVLDLWKNDANFHRNYGAKNDKQHTVQDSCAVQFTVVSLACINYLAIKEIVAATTKIVKSLISTRDNESLALQYYIANSSTMGPNPFWNSIRISALYFH